MSDGQSYFIAIKLQFRYLDTGLEMCFLLVTNVLWLQSNVMNGEDIS